MDTEIVLWLLLTGHSLSWSKARARAGQGSQKGGGAWKSEVFHFSKLQFPYTESEEVRFLCFTFFKSRNLIHTKYYVKVHRTEQNCLD